MYVCGRYIEGIKYIGKKKKKIQVELSRCSRVIQKRDARTDGRTHARTHGRRAFHNPPTAGRQTAGRRGIIKCNYIVNMKY